MRTQDDLLRIAAASQYARVFDAANKHWSTNKANDALFIRTQLNYTQDKLHARGHLFLNEIYDMFGFPRSSKGATEGWLTSRRGKGQVRFKIVELDDGFLIDFTPDGVIYDKIED